MSDSPQHARHFIPPEADHLIFPVRQNHDRSSETTDLIRDLAAWIEEDWAHRGCFDPDCPCSGGRVTKLLARARAALTSQEART